MSEHHFAGVGEAATKAQYTWGGPGPRRVCDPEGRPFPAGNQVATVNAGMYMVTDAKFGTQQWVYAGEMVVWDGVPDPTRQALRLAKDALLEAARLAGVAI